MTQQLHVPGDAINESGADNLVRYDWIVACCKQNKLLDWRAFRPTQPPPSSAISEVQRSVTWRGRECVRGVSCARSARAARIRVRTTQLAAAVPVGDPTRPRKTVSSWTLSYGMAWPMPGAGNAGKILCPPMFVVHRSAACSSYDVAALTPCDGVTAATESPLDFSACALFA